jgi:NTE family protein
MLRLTVLLLAGFLAGCATAPYEDRGYPPPREAELAPVRADRPVVGLVLGGGGARGFAHIGVIKALEAEGIRPDLIVGASSGALVAAFYAGGYGPRELEEAALGIEDSDLIDFTFFGPARVEGARLQDYVNRGLDNRSIEALPRPFAVVATERATSRMAVFTRGNTGIAVRASTAVPTLFWPVVIGGVEYVDGGVASRVPAPVARRMGADVVIAVDVSWRGTADAQAADVVIRPQAPRTRLLEFGKKLENIAAGEAAAREAIPAIRESIAAAGERKRFAAQPAVVFAAH